MAIVINSTTGEIDLDQTTPGTYVVTYTVEGLSSTQEVTVNAVDNAAFSYSASSYEPTDADPTPTITGLTGGTFSGTTGLVINSTTGEIDLSASTVAAHTVTYNTSSSGSSVCPNTSTFGLVITLNQIANNYSMNFDSASSDYVDAGSMSNIYDGTTSLTVSFWANLTDTGGYQFIFDSVDGGSSRIGFTIARRSNGNFIWLVNDDTSHMSTAYTVDIGFTLNNWHHVVLVYDKTNSNYYYYRDGIQYSVTPTISTNSNTSFYSLKIGRPSITNLYYTNGKIDELAIWNTALTATQVSEIYNATSTNLTKDLTTVSGSNLIYWNRMGD